MLKITRKVEYALIALSQMQMKRHTALTSVKEISTQNDIPYEILAKTMQLLARADIVEAVKGPRGGYRLIIDPSQIKMTTFFEIIEGPMGFMDCSFDSDCEQIQSCAIRTPIQRINDSIRDMFNNISLQDITRLS
ncbi:MAG: Rrf2 family transcriptional regulator [Candidatus Marinimicrobia bacterium]|nr:Rrf2 family transcriptional regulator [Candidatus Neomarinimicrobiota bacterium]